VQGKDIGKIQPGRVEGEKTPCPEKGSSQQEKERIYIKRGKTSAIRKTNRHQDPEKGEKPKKSSQRQRIKPASEEGGTSSSKGMGSRRTEEEIDYLLRKREEPRHQKEIVGIKSYSAFAQGRDRKGKKLASIAERTRKGLSDEEEKKTTPTHLGKGSKDRKKKRELP